MKISKKEYILKRIIKLPNGCWEWQRCTGHNGYGEATWNYKRMRAHRLSYEAFKDEIPKGICVCHTCDNRKCQNPKHLWIGTQKDNLFDMSKKGRSNKGEKNGLAKLMEKDILLIRILSDIGHSQRKIAAKYNVTQPTIGAILRGITWKHI